MTRTPGPGLPFTGSQRLARLPAPHAYSARLRGGLDGGIAFRSGFGLVGRPSFQVRITCGWRGRSIFLSFLRQRLQRFQLLACFGPPSLSRQLAIAAQVPAHRL
jgi:hypothetical protein